jgi:hypothetical protein
MVDAMDDDLLLFSLSRRRDMDRSTLRRILHAHIACGEAHAVREWLLRALIVAGLPVWAAALQPSRIPPSLRSMAVDLWAVGCVALAIAGIVEWRCRRLRGRYLEELSPSKTEGERCDDRP